MKRNTHTQLTLSLDKHEVEDMVLTYLQHRGLAVPAGQMSVNAYQQGPGAARVHGVDVMHVQFTDTKTEE